MDKLNNNINFFSAFNEIKKNQKGLGLSTWPKLARRGLGVWPFPFLFYFIR